MNTSSVNPNIAWACATAIILALLGGIFALTWHGSFSGADVLPVLAGIGTAALAIFGVHAGVTAGSKASAASTSSDPPSTSTAP